MFWRGVTAGALALAAALALFVIDRALLAPAQQGKSYVAVVNRGGDAPALIVRVDTASRTVYVRPLAAETPAGRSLELWYINAGQAPKSLGLVENAPARFAASRMTPGSEQGDVRGHVRAAGRLADRGPDRTDGLFRRNVCGIAERRVRPS